MQRIINHTLALIVMIIFLASCRMPAPPSIPGTIQATLPNNPGNEAVFAPSGNTPVPATPSLKTQSPLQQTSSDTTEAPTPLPISPETIESTEKVSETPLAVQALPVLTTTVVTTATTESTSRQAVNQAEVFKFGLQPGTPLGMQYFANPDLGCNWTGVAGQVFGKDGTPLNRVVIEVSGTLEGKEIMQIALTTEATIYGPGGYEVTLGDHPVGSQGTLRLQLKDLTGKPLSDNISFDTYSACDKNLVMINLIESSGEIGKAYLPFISPKSAGSSAPVKFPFLYLPLINHH